jgi:elongator complex protein 1
MRVALEEQDRSKYMFTILTTDAKRTPPDLEAAMERVKSVKSKSADEAESALKYLIFLADVDRLYDVALGMYDFQLVVMVAQHSQKDPREYLPFLTELRQLSFHRQRFRIDEHLGRFSKALVHLTSLVKESDEKSKEEGDTVFVELLKFVQSHQLYTPALDLFEEDERRKKMILNVYGDYLANKLRYKDAGLAYYMADEKRKALDSYKEALEWTLVFSIAQELQSSKEDILELAGHLSNELMEKHHYKDAALVYIEYAGDYEAGVKTLTRGSYWTEAIRMVCLFVGLLSLFRLCIKW